MADRTPVIQNAAANGERLGLKAVVRRTLRTVGLDLQRSPTAPRDPVVVYRESGCVPWSTGYQEAKDRLLDTVLADDEALRRFLHAEALPPGHGVGFDERVVEYPWAFARLPHGNGRLLDAGGTFNNPSLVTHPRVRAKTRHILTLVPEGHCQCARGVSHLYSDLRDVPIASEYYDVIVCISTLEHIGMDNTQYHGAVESAADDCLIAVREMRRVLRPGGTLLLTVPFGAPISVGSFQHFDRALIDGVITAFAPSKVEETYFRYTSDGWTLSNADACRDAIYVPWVMQSPEQRPATFPTQYDRAAAARAVACLQLTA